MWDQIQSVIKWILGNAGPSSQMVTRTLDDYSIQNYTEVSEGGPYDGVKASKTEELVQDVASQISNSFKEDRCYFTYIFSTQIRIVQSGLLDNISV